MKKITAVILAITILGASCIWHGRRVRGNGKLTSQSRPIGDINGVELHSSFDVILSEGSPSNVKIEAEENLIQYIDLHVVNGVVNIETEDNVWLRPKRKIKIFVTSPSFNRIENTGSGNITSQTKLSSDSRINIDVTGSGDLNLDLDAPEVKASVTGSGNVKLSGETQKFTADITGSGDIRAMNLLAEESNVELTGSGNADVYSSVKMAASITGSGDIRYKGGAEIVSKSISGSGDLKKVD
ncbi:head GIN domain-containing protein [Niastella populi]|uniref:Putative auto-transporter adhesin head GIN domain-containing protein n=1 Tax=Niastella populi TaxID=550983 RepID=A0A1V9FCS0_9BACT|nr:head GIN domain-containing protein [Niastella populi]OQP56180.1 hypothetical protein A4R26_26440 [Niastella populi]